MTRGELILEWAIFIRMGRPPSELPVILGAGVTVFYFLCPGWVQRGQSMMHSVPCVPSLPVPWPAAHKEFDSKDSRTHAWGDFLLEQHLVVFQTWCRFLPSSGLEPFMFPLVLRRYPGAIFFQGFPFLPSRWNDIKSQFSFPPLVTYSQNTI